MDFSKRICTLKGELDKRGRPPRSDFVALLIGRQFNYFRQVDTGILNRFGRSTRQHRSQSTGGARRQDVIDELSDMHNTSNENINRLLQSIKGRLDTSTEIAYGIRIYDRFWLWATMIASTHYLSDVRRNPAE